MKESIARSTVQIGEALSRQRRDQNMTQKDLGDQTHLRQATISRLENGEPGTRLQTLFDVLATLDLELVIRPRTRSRDIEELF